MIDLKAYGISQERGDLIRRINRLRADRKQVPHELMERLKMATMAELSRPQRDWIKVDEGRR